MHPAFPAHVAAVAIHVAPDRAEAARIEFHQV